MTGKPIPRSAPTIDADSFQYATICQSEDYTVVLISTSVQQLAAAWRAFTKTKLDPSKVDKVTILPA